MKSKCKFFVLFFVLGILSTGLKAAGEEKTKELHQGWTVNSIQTLEVSNKFGEIKINNFGGDSVTIDVVVTVEAPNEKRADELLELINVDFGKSGNTARAETKISNDFKSRQKFSIDYTINIPSDKNLNISNKYGNTIVNKLDADGYFNIQYGNLTANQLNAPPSGNMNLNLAYGKADIGSTNDMDIEVKYSTINVGGTGNLKIESKYSVLNIEESKVVNIESKYDTFEFEEVGTLSATTKYSHFKIEELKKKLKIEAGYGGISIDEVSDDFESISIENSYGQIKLGLDEASYSLDASCDYCGISYPEENFTGNRIKENNTQTVKGNVGTDGHGTVYIRSRYGEIKLR